MTPGILNLKNILIINPFGIGDVLFTFPAVKALRNAYPDARIYYWGNERTADICANNPDIYKVFSLSRGDLKKIYHRSWLGGIKRSLSLFAEIKRGNFDLAVDFSLDHRYGFISMIAGIKERIGFNYKNRGRFLTRKIGISGFAKKHMAEHYLELLGLVGIKPGVFNAQLFVPPKTLKWAEEVLLKAGICREDLVVGIAPGAGLSWGQNALLKHWPPAKYAQLIDKIFSELDAKVILLGNELERHIAENIISAARSKVVDLVGQTDLIQLCALIRQLTVLITNDGGPLHIAAASGIKTVSIFGPVDENVYGPYPLSGHHIIVKSDLDCRPCYRDFRLAICQRHRECINSITVDEVFNSLRRLL